MRCALCELPSRQDRAAVQLVEVDSRVSVKWSKRDCGCVVVVANDVPNVAVAVRFRSPALGMLLMSDMSDMSDMSAAR